MTALPSSILPVLIFLFLLPCRYSHPTEPLIDQTQALKNESNSLQKESLNVSSPYATCDKINLKNAALQCYQSRSRVPMNIPLTIRNCENATLFAGTTIRKYCRPGYQFETPHNLTYSEITCDDEGRWNGDFNPCVPKQCKKLSTKNAEIRCSWKGIDISDCNENSEMLIGTIVHLLCKPGYGEGPPIYLSYSCQRNLEWSHSSIMSRCDIPTGTGDSASREFGEKIRKTKETWDQLFGKSVQVINASGL